MMNLKNLMNLMTVAAFLTVSCAQKTKSDDPESDTSAVGSGSSGGGSSKTTFVQPSIPADSTGTSVDVKIQLASNTATTMALAGGVPLDLGNGVTVDSARVSIRSIKIKASKQESSEEKELAAIEGQEDKAEAEEGKESEKALEAEKESAKKQYEANKEAAGTESEKAAVEAQWEAAKAVLEEKKAQAEAAKELAKVEREAQRDGNVKWKGPYIFDFLSGTTDKELPTASLVDGSYERIEFKLHPNRDLPGSDPLLNKTLYVAGSVLLNGVSVPFNISYHVDEEIKLKGTGAVKMESGVLNNLGVVFDIGAWLTGVNFNTAVKDPTGVIVIDAQTNESILKTIKLNIKSHIRFGEDHDGDGEVEESESAGDGSESAQEAEAAEVE